MFCDSIILYITINIEIIYFLCLVNNSFEDYFTSV